MERELQEEIQAELNDDDILVHMSMDEIENLSKLQPSGVVRNNPWKIPEFHELNDLLNQNPQIKEMIAQAFQKYVSAPEHEKNAMYNESAEIVNKIFPITQDLENAGHGESPVAEQIGLEGRNGDTEVALMPKELFEFLWSSVPDEYRNVNPNTGFPEFDFWKGLVGILGGFAGSFIPGIGPVLGSSLGAAAGRLIGSMFDGDSSSSGSIQNIQNNYQPKIDEHGYEYDDDYYDQLEEAGYKEAQKGEGFLPRLGKFALGAGLPFLSSFLPDSGQKVLNADLSPKDKKADANSTSETDKKADANSTSVTVKKALMPTYSPVDMLNALNDLFGRKDKTFGANAKHDSARANSMDRRNLRKYEAKKGKAAQEHRQFNQGLYDNYMARFHPSGGYIPGNLTTQNPSNTVKFLNYKDGGEVIRHIEKSRSIRLIKGDESGQADNIYVKVPEHSYIVDAATVANIGDGCTENGAKRLKEYFDKVKKVKVPYKKDVDCALSAGEVEIPPEYIAGLGEGDVSLGIKIMDAFVKKIREVKGMNPKKIPKPTKNIKTYITKIATIMKEA